MENINRIDLDKNLGLLREKLFRALPESGSFQTRLKDLQIHRYDAGHPPKPVFYQPVVIIVVQGKKLVRIGGREIPYGEHTYFISGVDMPAASCVVEARPDKPYLSLSMNLDKSLLLQMATEVPPSPKYGREDLRGAMVQAICPDMLDAFWRLIELAEKGSPEPVLEELLKREIHYRLLTSPFGNQLRRLNASGTQSNQIVRAITWLKENYKEPLRVETLAGGLNMAVSTFHKHFKDITTLSPLQYQKQLRLTEAQRLMLTDDYDATSAAFAVGYESPTQFSREYKRLFGQSPRRDVSRVQRLAS